MAHRLVNNAYARTRDSQTRPQRLAQEAAVLLEESLRLDGNNLHTLRLLMEALRNTGTAESEALQKETLRKIIRLDPGDMVAQVAYLDLIASGSQVLEERARIYQGAMGSAKLDPQIRSQMAVRLARLATERGDAEEAKGFVNQAIAFNDVNVEALREQVRLGDRSGPGRLKNLITLLNANPYQPTAWVEVANVLASAGVHDRAADCLTVAMEQTYVSGLPPAGDLYLQLGLEYAAAGRLAEAHPVLAGLARLEDAPLSAMMASELLSQEYAAAVRPVGGFGAATGPATMRNPAREGAEGERRPAREAPREVAPAEPPEPVAVRLVKKLSKAIADQPKELAPLAEGAWVQLAGMKEVTPEAATWLKAYAGMVPADDATLARLTGWQLLREKKFVEAEAALARISAGDPLAQLGLARALIEQNKIPEAARQLQDLWASHPTGLLAFQVAQTARMARIQLNPTVTAQQLLEAMRALPRKAMVAHRDPKEQQLLMISLTKRSIALGEPVMLSVRLMNTTDAAASVGPDGVIRTTLGLVGGTRGMEARQLGMFVLEDLHRTYRLERRGSIEATVRADMGFLFDLLSLNPTQAMTVGVGAVLAPRGSTRQPLPGLGGQSVTIGDFERVGVPLRTDALMKLAQEAGAQPLDKQMLHAELLSTLLAGIPTEFKNTPRNEQEAADRQNMASLRELVVKQLQDFVKSPSPVMRAWMVQNIPPGGVNETIQKAMDNLGSDPDRLVRMMWGIRQVVIARGAMKEPGARKDLLTRLEQTLAAEKDESVKRWLTLLLEDEREADAKAAAAATQPATAPGEQP
jgi:tetratricopeptide (TPR) repeat protein